MNKFLQSSFFVLLIPLANSVYADFGGSISLASDYRYRGVSQTGEKPAVQGGIEYFHSSGIYAGWWGSNVDYYSSRDSFDNNEKVEHNLYVGFFSELGENLSYDLTYYQYFYPETETNVDSSEIELGVDYKSLRLAYWYAEDSFNLGENYSYIEANYELSLPGEFSLTFHAGYSFGNSLDLVIFGFDEYLDHSITLEKNVAGLEWSVAYSNTDISGEFVIDDGFNANQEAMVFALSKRF